MDAYTAGNVEVGSFPAAPFSPSPNIPHPPKNAITNHTHPPTHPLIHPQATPAPPSASAQSRMASHKAFNGTKGLARVQEVHRRFSHASTTENYARLRRTSIFSGASNSIALGHGVEKCSDSGDSRYCISCVAGVARSTKPGARTPPPLAPVAYSLRTVAPQRRLSFST